jgi:DNA-binding protein Fis
VLPVLPALNLDPTKGVDLATLKLDFERRYVDAALACTGGNKEKAASLLGMDGAALRKALRERLA